MWLPVILFFTVLQFDIPVNSNEILAKFWKSVLKSGKPTKKHNSAFLQAADFTAPRAPGTRRKAEAREETAQRLVCCISELGRSPQIMQNIHSLGRRRLKILDLRRLGSGGLDPPQPPGTHGAGSRPERDVGSSRGVSNLCAATAPPVRGTYDSS